MTRARISSTAAVALLVAGCATPGYRVRLESHGVGRDERDRVFGDVDMEARGNGFETVWRNREDRGAFPGVTSSYVRRLSDRWRDHLSLDVHWFAKERTLVVQIENALRGAEAPVKAEIDALGDACLARMSTRLGRSRVSVRRERTRIPLVD